MWRSLQKQDRGAKQGTEHCNSRCENFARWNQGAKIHFKREAERPAAHQLRASGTHEQPSRSISAMAKTRGGFPHPHPHRCLDQQSAIGGATSPPAQDPAIPPSEGNPSQRRYPPGGHPLTLCHPPTNQEACFSATCKRTKFSGPGEPSQAPQAEPPTEDSQIPGDSSRDRHQASYDRRTTYRGQPGLQRSILPLRDLL
ncbi:hypothetical protein CK203_113479 [Vitis vinifera]|uniref:Uncharacterized protein n=1 Tax=Vitis vinifera TaxID=29760 RepID=A0A438C8F3_VITVI|nr:hypothetical protein CK203_113479 [Vitis vinifera]